MDLRGSISTFVHPTEGAVHFFFTHYSFHVFYWQSNRRVDDFTMCILSDTYVKFVEVILYTFVHDSDTLNETRPCRQKVFYPTKTNLPLTAGDFPPKSNI